MKNTLIKTASALVLFVTAGIFNNALSSKDIPSEIELMKLEFALACEVSERCKNERKDLKDIDNVQFKEYKVGTGQFDYVVKVKQGKVKSREENQSN
ncbi:MAG: hypothetical protein V2I48_14855 [Xanthomonadales bacterium]|jgi:hypothetical protein|nr:hypothetical protein [Xanthomonadales bacterium]